MFSEMKICFNDIFSSFAVFIFIFSNVTVNIGLKVGIFVFNLLD